MLERSIAELGIYPAVDPLASTSKALAPDVVGDEHYAVARGVQKSAPEVQGLAGHHRHPGHGRTLARGQAGRGPRPQNPAFPEPAFHVGRNLHGHRRACTLSLKDTIQGFKEILDGKHDDVPETAFYMKGGIDSIKTEAKAS